MMLEDGINEINWNAMFESFARIQRDKKGNQANEKTKTNFY